MKTRLLFTPSLKRLCTIKNCCFRSFIPLSRLMIMFLPCWFTWSLPPFNTPSREISIAVALEVAANLHEWALNCEVSISAFLRTFFTEPVRVDFWISLLGFKWLSNNWHCPFLRHELDLFRYSSRHPYTWIPVLRICPKFQACNFKIF